jgi:hypothetical protein
MKIRNGFVSNSSSSSFIVGFKRKPKTVAELKTLLFGDAEHMTMYDYTISTQDAAQQVFNDLKGKRPLTKEKMLNTLNSGYFPGYPHMDYRSDKPSDLLRKEFYDKYPKLGENLWSPDKLKNKDAQALARKFVEAQEGEWAAERKMVDDSAKLYFDEVVIPKMKGYKVYAFSYSDNDGEMGCVLEHGDTFHNLPHVVISQH